MTQFQYPSFTVPAGTKNVDTRHVCDPTWVTPKGQCPQCGNVPVSKPVTEATTEDQAAQE